MSERSYALLVNPSAGGGRARKLLPEIELSLAKWRLRYRIIETAGLDHGEEQANEAAARGEIPVVVSGDGLVGRVGGALAGGSQAMGVIPGGRGNDFARVVGIPTDIDAAVEVLAKANTRRVDVGDANGVRFLCIASCGFDSSANRIANDAKLIKGPLVYAYAGIRALIGWKPAAFEVQADDRRYEFVGYSVAAANSKAYGGGMFLAPDAELDDGLLDLVMTSDVPKREFIKGLKLIFDGEHIHKPEVEVTRAAEVTIAADRPFAVYADGEHITDLPATVRLLPSALELYVP